MQKGECVMNAQGQTSCAPVPAAKQAQQAQDIRARWAWVEASVWTERMLKALEEGLEGDKWFRLIDKVMAERTLQRAWEKVRSNGGSPGVDGITIERFNQDSQARLLAVKEQLQAATYQPKPVKRVWIDKPGSRQKRPLGVPSVNDRIVQGALRMVIEPIFEREFAKHSYGFRPRRGCKDALRRVDWLLREGRAWVVDADLKSYFDTIPHARLMELVERKIADGRVLKLIQSYLKQGVMEQFKHYQAGEEGTPQGAVMSPLLANIYLDGLDHLMAGNGFEMVRYADDFVVLCHSREQAQEALQTIQQWVEQAGLQLHPEKTRLVNMNQAGGGFDFLGYHFERGKRTPRKKSLKKFKDAIRKATPRTSGQSMKSIVAALRPVMRGWFHYFQHSSRWVFPELDCWIRGRLRSILRRRTGRHGRARGRDHQRWPNSTFTALGYFSLKAAWIAAKSLPKGATP
jgi:RNA-directed DNA polymerase